MTDNIKFTFAEPTEELARIEARDDMNQTECRALLVMAIACYRRLHEQRWGRAEDFAMLHATPTIGKKKYALTVTLRELPSEEPTA